MRQPEEYARLRAECPIRKITLPQGRTAWLVTRYEDVRQLLLDPRVTASRTHSGFPLQIALPDDIPAEQLVSFVGMDPPEHTDQRRMLLPEFTVKRIQSMRPRVQETADSHITAMLAGDRPTDLVQALALPIPSLLTCELLGLPYADHKFFEEQTAVVLNRNATKAAQRAANTELLAYLHQAVAEKERIPSADLLGRLIVRQREAGTFDHDALVGTARLLLVAGHEATPNAISLGTVALLENPRQLAEIKNDPSLTPKAIEELLRYFSIADQSTSRVALTDIEIGGVTIRKGEGIIGLNASANHDPEIYTDPDLLDIHRSAPRHLAFGYGHHQCIGQNLARMTMEVVFNTLFARIPTLRLAVPVDQLAFKDDSTVYGVCELPVTW